MAAIVGKAIARKLVSTQQKKTEEQRMKEGRDPFFYYETDKNGRKRKRAKSSVSHYPEYIPLEDRKRLNSFRKYAKYMDTAFFGHVGADAILGLIPVAGDMLSGGIAYRLVSQYAKTVSCGLPGGVYAKMMRNIVIDLGVGLVPVIGDVADAIWKANAKNLVLLEDHLRKVFGPAAGGVVKPAAETANGGGQGRDKYVDEDDDADEDVERQAIVAGPASARTAASTAASGGQVQTLRNDGSTVAKAGHR